MILRLGRRGPGFEPRNSPVFQVMFHDFSWVVSENDQRGRPISSEVRASVLCAESHGFEPRMGQLLGNSSCFCKSAHVHMLGADVSLCKETYRAHGVVVSRLLRMQKALGSNPSGSILVYLCIEIMVHGINGFCASSPKKCNTASQD